MGQNKALMLFHGQPLIARIISRLAPAADEILVVANQPDLFKFLGLPVFKDIIPHKGALGGLFTALSYANNPVLAVVACDMPFINPNLLIAERNLLCDGNWDVVIPRSERGLEPLHSIYRRETCLPVVQQAIEQERLRMTSWFWEVKVRTMEPDEISGIDPDLRSLNNINTPEEFRQAETFE